MAALLSDQMFVLFILTGLSAANNQTVTDQATLAYASVYPAALIFKILFAQILVTLLLRF